jgi:RNA polymerase sigma factor (sigma-70 family)
MWRPVDLRQDFPENRRHARSKRGLQSAVRGEPTAIHGFVAAMIPRTADVDDVFQEVSMSLWRKFEDFEPGTDFAAWAIQSARFYVLKHYERQRQLGRVVFDDELVNPVPPTMNHVTNPVDWEGLQESLQVAKQRGRCVCCRGYAGQRRQARTVPSGLG